MQITAPDLAEVDFIHAFHWDIKFLDYSGSNLFPAVMIQDTKFNFETSTIEHGGGNFDYPTRAGRGDFTIQLVEITDWKLCKWLDAWCSEIYWKPEYTVGLLKREGIARDVILYDQNGDKSNVIVSTITVIPSSEVTIEKSSSKSDAVNLQVNFKKVGTVAISSI